MLAALSHVRARAAERLAGALLVLSGVRKAYGDVVTCDSIDLVVAPGEVVGLLGENGAGKSTLVSILGGLIRPDSGEIRLAGQRIELRSPRDAAAAGIAIVHQHSRLVASFTVEENLALADPRFGRFRLDRKALREHFAKLAAEVGIEVDLDAVVATLPLGARLGIEILRALARRPRLLVLDEPTAVLSADERDALRAMVAALAAGGTAVVLVTREPEDVLDLGGRVVVMRGGRIVHDGPARGRGPDDLVRLMVGEDLNLPSRDALSEPGAVVLEVTNLGLVRPDGSRALAEASFTLRAGEILGVCGVDGNGQTELLQALAGMIEPAAGRIRYPFVRGNHGGPQHLRRRGVAHLPEERLRHGGVASLSLEDNWLLTRLDRRELARNGWLRRRALRRDVSEAIDAFAIRAPSPTAAFGSLSAGDQQKLVIAREVRRTPKVVLAGHPTRGLDLRAIAFVLTELAGLRDRGAGVLFVSADLGEILQIADRVMVLTAGRLIGPVAAAEATPAEIGAWMSPR